ncbi:MAG: hypothetical protein ACRCYY_18735, partial [Trueperaceae bacterium]
MSQIDAALSTDAIDALIEQSYGLPHGSQERFELLNRAVALADSLNDLAAGVQTRDELIHECEFGGRPEAAVVAFAWLLAKFDEHGEAIGLDSHDILWKYKWILNDLWGFSRMSHEQIERTFADFEERLQRAGYSLRTLYYFQLKYALHQGDDIAIKTLYKKWQKSKRDAMSDCTACEADFHVEYSMGLGEYERGLELAQPLLKGRMSCAEVPHVTYGTVLEPLLYLQRYDEAIAYHQKGYKMIKDNPDFLVSTGEHLAFLAYTHNLGMALSLFERHLPWALATFDLERRFEFYLSSLPLWHRLKERGDTVVKVR